MEDVKKLLHYNSMLFFGMILLLFLAGNVIINNEFLTGIFSLIFNISYMVFLLSVWLMGWRFIQFQEFINRPNRVVVKI